MKLNVYSLKISIWHLASTVCVAFLYFWMWHDSALLKNLLVCELMQLLGKSLSCGLMAYLLMVPPKHLSYVLRHMYNVGSLKELRRWDAEADHPIEEVKELGKSKWSNNLDEDDIHKNETKQNLNSLSGLIKSYRKDGKSVRWSDQVCLT